MIRGVRATSGVTVPYGTIVHDQEWVLHQIMCVAADEAKLEQAYLAMIRSSYPRDSFNTYMFLFLGRLGRRYPALAAGECRPRPKRCLSGRW